MDPAVVVLLAGLLLIAAQALWFGVIKPVGVLAWLQQASFVVAVSLLIPLVLFVHYSQSTAIDRLQVTGVKAHPAIKHAIGVANGRGENPVWVFSLDNSASGILDFYRKAMTGSEWRIAEDNGLYLLYRKPGQTLMIANQQRSGGNKLIISVTEKP